MRSVLPIFAVAATALVVVAAVMTTAMAASFGNPMIACAAAILMAAAVIGIARVNRLSRLEYGRMKDKGCISLITLLACITVGTALMIIFWSHGATWARVVENLRPMSRMIA